MEKVVQFLTSAKAYNHPMLEWGKSYKKHLEEAGEPEGGELRGQTVSDAAGVGTGMQVAATYEFLAGVHRGFTRYMDDSFLKKYTTESVIFKIPLVEYQELVTKIGLENGTNVAGTSNIAGQFLHTEKLISYAYVDLSTPESEKGGKISWTRSFLEDVTFDAQAEMAEGLGHAVAVYMMQEIIDELANGTRYITEGLHNPSNTSQAITTKALYQAEFPSGGIISLPTPINWTAFLSVPAAVDQGTMQSDNTWKTYGPADFILVSTDIYWQLLNIIQLTNVLYEGSTDPITSGRIKLSLGCTVVKQSLLPQGTMIALNSEKAIALVSRRTLKIEPVLFPVWNEYGFIASVRYGVTTLFPQAIQTATQGNAL
jgi:hypothetical protein